MQDKCNVHLDNNAEIVLKNISNSQILYRLQGLIEIK